MKKVEHSLSGDAISGIRRLMGFVGGRPELPGAWRACLSSGKINPPGIPSCRRGKPVSRIGQGNENQGYSR
ncbi:MAG: hypothetical protein IMW97_06605 [Firmicutes bacterium]|nr:hypothetical protein [Candidatus Fermentithermobacillaceae bacterium]